MIAVASAAGFEPVPAVVTSRRDEALAAVATDGRPTLVGRVSNAIEDRVVGPDSAAAAIDALLPHGAVMVRRLAPVPLTIALVAGDAVISELPPAAAGVARDLAGRLGVQPPDVETSAVEDESTLLDLATGDYFGLNRIGAVVWELLAEPRSLDALAAAITARYAVERAKAREDVARMLVRMRERGLVRVGPSA
jgi:hypothetical protein